MSQVHQCKALIEWEGDGLVALCPELNIASQGDYVEGVLRNLQETFELFFVTTIPTRFVHG